MQSDDHHPGSAGAPIENLSLISIENAFLNSETMDEDAGSDTSDSHGRMARRAVMLGALGATSVLTIRPALAQAAGSVLNCQIPVPDPFNASKHVAADGSLVPAGTAGAFPGKTLLGQDVKNALNSGGTISGTSSDQSAAYMNYLRKLQSGQAGYSCYASLRSR